MQTEVSIMGGCPVPNLCSPLLYLAELEAEGKAKKARLRAQQRGRVAKGKKGRLERFLRSLWGKTIPYPANSQRIEVCRPPLRSRHSSSVHRAEQFGRPERKGQSSHIMRQLPPEEKKG
jgi:hypothetical protein